QRRRDSPDEIARHVVLAGGLGGVAEQHERVGIDLARGLRDAAVDEQVTARELHDAGLAAVGPRQLLRGDIDPADLVRVREMARDVGVLRVLRLAVQKRREALLALPLLARALLGFTLRAIALGALGVVAQRIRLREVDLRALALVRRALGL